MAVCLELLEEDALTALSAVRAPGAVRVTVDLPDVGLVVTEEGFLEAAVWRSRIADDVLVMLLFDDAGLDVTVLPEVAVVLFTGRLLTVLPPRRELVPANTRSEPVLCLVPLYTRGLWSLSG